MRIAFSLSLGGGFRRDRGAPKGRDAMAATLQNDVAKTTT
jgi:hypothetical protein